MTTRTAVVGTGFVGAQHVEALRRLGDVEVALVVASSPSSAEEAARRLHVPSATDDYRRVLDDAAIDVVHVCTPNAFHAEMATAALQAGKHVVCEKPLAMDSHQAASLARLAESSDRVTVLCHNYRFFPMAAELRAMVAEGAIGEPHLVRGAYLQDWLLLPTDYNWRLEPEAGGRSRAVADIGSHWIDLAETVTGRRLETVMADLATIIPRRRATGARTFESGDGTSGPSEWRDVTTEDQATMLLRFAGGLRGAVTISQMAAGQRNGLEISVDGSTGSATWRQEQPDILTIGRREGPNEVFSRSPNAGSAAQRALARLPAGHNEGWADGLRNLFSVAYAVIRGETPASETPVPLPTFRDGYRHHLFIEAALESSARRAWVSTAEGATASAAAGGETTR